MYQLFRCRNMHGSGEGIIRGLGHIDMVIRMNRFFAPHFTPSHFNSPIGNHFIGIHIGLGAASRLPNSQGKMGIQFTFNDFIGGLHY